MLGQFQRKYLGATIPVINIHGAINLDLADKVSQRLAQINTTRAVALAVSVNSPGGLPVQSQIAGNRILKFARNNNLKVYTFALDVAASGGYWILSMGDQVIADRNSIVGSIGVLINKMFFKGFLDKTSIENKTLTSNEKVLVDILNPFKDWKDGDKQFLKQRLGNTHDKFIGHVKKYRSKQLANDPEIFSGQIYTGEVGLQKGLVDEVGSMVNFMAKKYPDAKLDYPSQGKNFFEIIRQ